MLTMDIIRQAVMPLADKYNVVKVDVFGSYADGSATEKSDADFLVTFRAKVPSIFKVMGFKEELQSRLNHPVDVVTLPLARPGKLRIGKVVTVYER